MFVLLTSRLGFKLGYLGSKTRSLGQTKTPRGHIFEEIIMSHAENICLDINFETGHLGHMG